MPRALMIQGTASHAGKSLLTAAFGRWLHDQGLAVAPFKAQNMSLNSYVTLRGEEIARSQATQAEALGLEPLADMNPVLLSRWTGAARSSCRATAAAAWPSRGNTATSPRQGRATTAPNTALPA